MKIKEMGKILDELSDEIFIRQWRTTESEIDYEYRLRVLLDSIHELKRQIHIWVKDD